MNVELFRNEIIQIFKDAIELDEKLVKINSSDIYIKVGGYPSANHRMKTCCEVMYSLMDEDDNAIESPASGYGADLIIEYKLRGKSKYFELLELAALINERNSINEKAKKILNAPFLLGNIGEFICGTIFNIKLNNSRSHKGYDGVFTDGELEDKSVNIKFYSKNDYILDLKNEICCDYYLVLTGTKGTDNWNISDVYLFNTEELLSKLNSFNIKIGIATSVRKGLWDKSRIYPKDNDIYKLSHFQKQCLAIFK